MYPQPDLPALPGTYALFLRLERSARLRVGRLGCFDQPAGLYAYLGSAHGPGGLRARLGRHIAGAGKSRWHVDTLRAIAQVEGWHIAVGNQPLECAWSQALARLPGAAVPIPGFGAGDCRRGCAAHLVRLGGVEMDWEAIALPSPPAQIAAGEGWG